MRPEELPRVTAMMRALWPGGDSYDFSDETNEISLRVHEVLGFEPTLRVQYFRKRLP